MLISHHFSTLNKPKNTFSDYLHRNHRPWEFISILKICCFRYENKLAVWIPKMQKEIARGILIAPKNTFRSNFFIYKFRTLLLKGHDFFYNSEKDVNKSKWVHDVVEISYCILKRHDVPTLALLLTQSKDEKHAFLESFTLTNGSQISSKPLS